MRSVIRNTQKGGETMELTIWQEPQESLIILSCCSYNGELFTEPFEDDFFDGDFLADD